MLVYTCMFQDPLVKALKTRVTVCSYIEVGKMAEVLYFGYASNLLAERFARIVPNPKRHCIAKYKGYTLGFGPHSESWGGNMAMAVPCPGKEIWGAVWCLTPDQWEELKRQESVDKGVFQTKEVDLEKSDGSIIKAQLVFRPDGIVKDGKASAAYKNVIVTGGEQNGLPAEYLEQLRKLPVNDHTQSIDFSQIKSNF